MNSNQIDELIYKKRMEWSKALSILPYNPDDSRYDDTMLLRHTWETLQFINRQVREGERLHEEWKKSKYYYDNGTYIRLQKNTRKAHCYGCNIPLEKGEGMVFEYDLMHVIFCIHCDPQYEHCPICDYPMVEGKCLGKCSLHL